MIRIPLIFFCYTLICVNMALAQCPSAVPLVINTVTTTESRCQSSGTATVSVSGGNLPYVYSIISGPVLASPQSSNIFQSLSPGNYVVQVTDNCNTTITKSFSVAGSYSVPQLNITQQSPACPGGHDGSIQIDITNGRPPFLYSLVSPSPVTTGQQTGNVFTGLSAGIYTCRISDSCGNFQTRSVTLLDGNAGNFTLEGGLLIYQSCDSFAIADKVYVNTPSDSKLPYTVTLVKPDNSTVSHVINTASSYIYDTTYFRYHHVTGTRDNLQMIVTNNCGKTASYYLSMSSPLDMSPNTSPVAGCSGQYSYTFDLNKDNNGASGFHFHCNTITYTLLNAAGAILATQVNNSTFSGFPAGNGYKVIREDCCRKDTLSFNWDQAPPLKITYAGPNKSYVCKDGITSALFLFNNNTQGNIIVASGPPSVTFSDGTVHNYTWPDTIKNIVFYPYGTYLGSFAPGTYKVIAIDNCGQKDSVAFTLTAADMRHDTFNASLIKGCTNANKIMLNAVSNDNPSIYFPDASLTVNAIKNTNITVSPFNDSLVNLSSGSYYAAYTYNYLANPHFLSNMSNNSCDVIKDTINIVPYTQPVFDASAAVAVCGASRSAALLPDTTKGVSPFLYQITAGPVTRPAQSSPVFASLPTGTYTFLMQDACNNSYSSDVSINTLNMPAMVTTGSTCAGQSATLRFPASPFYSYAWQLPNGSSSTGNSLTINPVTPSSVGTYKITVTIALGGCTDNQTSSWSLQLCSPVVPLPLSLLSFTGAWQGDRLQLKWETTNEQNTGYYIVERSSDGGYFMPVQRVNATGEGDHTYSMIDRQPLPGLSYYRLQMTDIDGKTTYSKIITEQNNTVHKPDVNPRLITNETAIAVTYPSADQPAFVQLIGIDGKIWYSQPVVKGSVQTNIQVSHLPKGNYLVLIMNKGVQTAMQVMKR